MFEKILERFAREYIRDEQLAGPPFKSLATEIDFNTGEREVSAIHEKLAKRPLVLETVNTEACDAVPANVNARKVAFPRRDRCFIPRRD